MSASDRLIVIVRLGSRASDDEVREGRVLARRLGLPAVERAFADRANERFAIAHGARPWPRDRAPEVLSPAGPAIPFFLLSIGFWGAAAIRKHAGDGKR